jgi:signal transduction histidine kinase
MERRVVICAPTGQDALLAVRVFESASVSSAVALHAQELIEQLRHGAGCVVLVEEALTGSAMKIVGEYIAAQPTWSDIPVLLLTRSGADSEVVQRAVAELGNVTLLERPVRTSALLSATRSALRARQRQYQVRDADQRKDEFLATLAHELRNPLAPIQTSMGILKHLHPHSEPVTQLRKVVNRQVRHLTRLVDDLLDVARITSGKVVLRKAGITLDSVLNHAVEISTSAMEVKHHTLAVEAPQEGWLLDADQARLVQTIANLLVNAAKFTPPQGLIALRASVRGNELVVSVQDNGIGMEASSLQRIFDLFAQTPVPGEVSTGLGIGLSLARQFAQMHGGSLQATSDGLDTGSEFVLTLPVVVGRAEAAQPQEDFQPTSNFVGLEGIAARRILVVDDNVDAANTLHELLDLDGFDVTTVYDGVAAVAKAETFQPEIVVMDIGMPGMDGYDAARLIRQQPGGAGMVLIAVTGWGQAADKKRAGQAGFDHHLVKPVDYDQLMQCLQN